MAKPIPSLVGHYRRMLARRAKPAEGGLESIDGEVSGLDPANIRERTAESRENLLKLVETYYGKDEYRKSIVERIIQEGGEALRQLAGNDAQRLNANPQGLKGLEAIVRTDGSRPSFLIRDGEIDRASSPIGSWDRILTDRAAQLRTAIASVGRIDVPGTSVGFQGTGFLVGPNVILTNRHVPQGIAQPQADGTWKLFPDVAIDFGHEYKARDTVNRRLLKRVLFSGSQPIGGSSLDHTKLDLALIELESAIGDRDQVPFNLQVDPQVWSNPTSTIFIVGYPGSPPPFVYEPSLLDQLFQASFGYKRFAPGEVLAGQNGTAPWTVSHDATTLGGNSGSVVLAMNQEGLAVGLHYGGRASAPAANWGHKLEHVLAETDGRSRTTLFELLRENGVQVVGQPKPRPDAPPPAVRTIGGHASDWRTGVTLSTMQRLTTPDATILEAPGDGYTSAEAFAGRSGYDPEFLLNFPIPLPLAPNDMRTMKGSNDVELKYEHFSVIMSASRRMPMLTACNINGGEARSVPRIQKWSYDGRLEQEHQWGNELYKGNDLDRGHMVRREDLNWGSISVAKRANLDTFHYTNSCPQMAGVNQKVWLGLENYILSHTKEDAMLVSVFTGPFFTASDFPYRGALVPKSFWKIVAFLLPDGRPSATAYRVSQDRELQDLEFVFAGYKTFQISVQQVADATGLDFSAMIPFDGFSQHERVHGVTLTERIDRLDQIHV